MERRYSPPGSFFGLEIRVHLEPIRNAASLPRPLHPTRLGRIPAGSKGLGRLAALRMGSKCTLISRPKKDPGGEYRLSIDWDRYDRVQVVEDVLHTINRFPRPAGRKDGSEIRVENLKDRVGRIDVKRLARAMILLADPFGDDPEGFKPVLVASEFSDLAALV